MFTAMKSDTNNSSNFHPDNVMKNIVIPAQARSKIVNRKKVAKITLRSKKIQNKTIAKDRCFRFQT